MALATDMNFLYPCGICGREVDLVLYDLDAETPRVMRDRHLCFDCAFWSMIAENRPLNSIVVDGDLVVPSYIQYDPFAPIIKDRKVFILKFTGEAIKANSLVNYGTVPEQFLDRLPNEGAYVNYHVYRRALLNHGHNCMKRGCYDRYHCFYYHPEIAEPDGPWNVIPSNHKAGWEECPLFIDKSKIFNEPA